MKKINEIWSDILKFFSSPKCVFWLGFIIAFAATAAETLRGRAENYHVYSDATNLFLNGVSPYTEEFVDSHHRYFLYLPPFMTIFAPMFSLPQWLGPFVWNLGNYCLMFLAIRTLPEKLSPYRNKIFLFVLSILLQSIFCYQYNVVVCYIFLFAFTLLENNRPTWAILLIMISACTKIYGGVELAILLFYPHFWKNLGTALLIGIALIFSPLLNFGYDNPMGLYKEMYDILTAHNSENDWAGILYLRGLKEYLLPHSLLIQCGVLGCLGLLCFLLKDKWNNFRFRVLALAALMGYIILFSDAPETHTYVIALSGYQLAFWLQPSRKYYDWILYWTIFVLFCIMPTDVLCPASIFRFFHWDLNMGTYVFFAAWLYGIAQAIKTNTISEN